MCIPQNIDKMLFEAWIQLPPCKRQNHRCALGVNEERIVITVANMKKRYVASCTLLKIEFHSLIYPPTAIRILINSLVSELARCD